MEQVLLPDDEQFVFTSLLKVSVTVLPVSTWQVRLGQLSPEFRSEKS